MSTLNFKKRKFDSDFPHGKTSKFVDGKGVSAPQKFSDTSKNVIKKQ